MPFLAAYFTIIDTNQLKSSLLKRALLSVQHGWEVMRKHTGACLLPVTGDECTALS